MKHGFLLPVLLTLVPIAQAALPGDSAEGKKLHDANCTSCHNSSVYTRPDHQIKNLPALKQQLNECTHAAQVTLTDAQQQSLVKYLNEQFYKLNK
jgi:mono/diheme cytochrome c family protein